MRHNFLSRRPSTNQQRAPISYEVGSDQRPKLGGVDLLNLVKTYGTPLYVMDAATVRAAAATYRDTLRSEYPGESLPLYACKANMSMGLCKLLEQEGLGLDVVSGGELYTAIQAGFPMDKVLFNGNNKTWDELEMAVHHKVGRISVDNFYELDLIHQIAEKKKRKVDILLRLAPGIECHTHDYIKTGQTDTKFGFDMSMLAGVIERILEQYAETIELKGLHAHIGSQIFEIQPYEDLVQILMNICFNVRQSYNGLTMTELNIGGGMGVQYTKEDDPPQIQSAISRITTKLRQYADQIRYPLPKLYMEPGRSIVATAGITLYKIGSMKAIPRMRKFVAIDGGMGDNIRPSLYQAKYSAVIANRLNAKTEETVSIVGKYCESGDVLIPQFLAPRLDHGDTLMVFGTGAYNYSMASNYNRIPRPAVVLVEEGKAHLLVKRETYEAIIQHDLIPDYLMAPKPSPEELQKAQAVASTKSEASSKLTKTPVAVVSDADTDTQSVKAETEAPEVTSSETPMIVDEAVVNTVDTNHTKPTPRMIIDPDAFADIPPPEDELLLQSIPDYQAQK